MCRDKEREISHKILFFKYFYCGRVISKIISSLIIKIIKAILKYRLTIFNIIKNIEMFFKNIIKSKSLLLTYYTVLLKSNVMFFIKLVETLVYSEPWRSRSGTFRDTQGSTWFTTAIYPFGRGQPRERRRI